MVKKSFSLRVDNQDYQVEVLRPGVISVNGNVFNVEVAGKGVTVDDQELVASLSEDFAIVGGKLYETEWSVESS
jgi:hypothetical protein